MIKTLVLILTISLFSACSFDAKPDEWKYKSINAFSSYTKNFLSNRDSLAKSDLKRAVTHAKQSANLIQLSRIYLGKCALNISVGIDDKCLEYMELSDLVDDKSMGAYYKLITTSLTMNDAKHIDAKYEDFTKYILASDYTRAKEEVFDMKTITSKLLSASLIRDKLNFDEVGRLIDSASYYGYKKSVIYWLNIQKDKTRSINKIKEINKRIKILGS